MDTRNGMVGRVMMRAVARDPIAGLKADMSLAGVYSSHWLDKYNSMTFEAICEDIGNRAVELAQPGGPLTATEKSFVNFGRNYW